MEEQVGIPPSDEVTAEEHRQAAGAVGGTAVSAELGVEWWDDYTSNMPQSD